MKKIRGLKFWVEGYAKAKNLLEELKLAIEFHREGELSEEEVDQLSERLTNEVEELEFRNMLSRRKTNSMRSYRSLRAPEEQKAATGPVCLCACT